MVPETLYVVQATFAEGYGRTYWSAIKQNAEMFADQRQEDRGVVSVIIYEMDLPDLITGALDEVLNSERTTPEDLTVVREYRV